MNIPYIRAPHSEGAPNASVQSAAPNAALLIDFDNVTMGMRSDLSKELKNLLQSDIIKGKVTVQRAYADWRRYPQYIVPLSEASIDLIFAPAYGSSKKNATDIRMAIDGMELVFIRPEIGTYILLTGDSDFSSLVLKLKEYGKYVIGVGIQESSSDILVQNCDEYYSYTSLTGLRKSGSGGDRTGLDPWVLAEKAVEQMKRRKDVMRSDRLKQVMLELDSSFDEKSLGFSKFSRFLTEAAQKGVLKLKKMENGQYEIATPSGSSSRAGSPEREAPSRSRSRESRSSRSDSRRSDSRRSERPSRDDTPAPSTSADPADLKDGYELLVEAIGDLLADHDGDAVRDSDVKRRMLALRESWDEAELGFPKFSRFLQQAHDQEIIDLRKGPNGNYEVALGAKSPGSAPEEVSKKGDAPAARPATRTPEPSTPPREEKSAPRLRPRTSVRRRGDSDEPPPLFEGQAVGGSTRSAPTKQAPSTPAPTPSGDDGALDLADLGLPTDRDSAIKYLANSYKGVGKKTAETLVDELGDDLFPTLHSDPDRVRKILPPSRADKVLEQWEADHERRQESGGDGRASKGGGRRRGGRRTRSRSSR
jgi:uncharacterized protein (TIGR00288 family)